MWKLICLPFYNPLLSCSVFTCLMIMVVLWVCRVSSAEWHTYPHLALYSDILHLIMYESKSKEIYFVTTARLIYLILSGFNDSSEILDAAARWGMHQYSLTILERFWMLGPGGACINIPRYTNCNGIQFYHLSVYLARWDIRYRPLNEMASKYVIFQRIQLISANL